MQHEYLVTLTTLQIKLEIMHKENLLGTPTWETRSVWCIEFRSEIGRLEYKPHIPVKSTATGNTWAGGL